MLAFKLHDRTRCTMRLTRAELTAQYELVTTLEHGVQKMAAGINLSPPERSSRLPSPGS